MYGESPARYGVAVGRRSSRQPEPAASPAAHDAAGLAVVQGCVGRLDRAEPRGCCLASRRADRARARIAGSPGARFWLDGAFTLSSAAFTTVAVTCELTFVLMLPFTLAWRAWRKGRWRCGGRVARALRQREDLPAAVPALAGPASPVERGRGRPSPCRRRRVAAAWRSSASAPIALAGHAGPRRLVVAADERVVAGVREPPAAGRAEGRPACQPPRARRSDRTRGQRRDCGRSRS